MKQEWKNEMAEQSPPCTNLQISLLFFKIFYFQKQFDVCPEINFKPQQTQAQPQKKSALPSFFIASCWGWRIQEKLYDSNSQTKWAATPRLPATGSATRVYIHAHRSLYGWCARKQLRQQHFIATMTPWQIHAKGQIRCEYFFLFFWGEIWIDADGRWTEQFAGLNGLSFVLVSPLLFMVIWTLHIFWLKYFDIKLALHLIGFFETEAYHR